jgi:drug/metabolite transporter (DMT)-like permease
VTLSDSSKAYLQIHLCVILWGFTPILGRLISLDALALVWWRMLIVVLALLLMPPVWRQIRAMSWSVMALYAAIGLLVATHWLLYYGAVKLANASVGAICIAVAPLFLVFLEPWLMRHRFNPRELLLGIGVIPGVALIVGGIPAGMYLGLALGLGAAFFAAAFSVCNKRMVEHGGPLAVTCIELGAGALFLTVLAPFLPHSGAALPLPDWHDAWLLLVLSLVCTLLPFALVLRALRHVSAFGQQFSTNLEPVYAIVLAIPLLGEQYEVGVMFYVGVVVVIAAVLLHPLISRRKTRKLSEEALLTSEAHNVSE